MTLRSDLRRNRGPRPWLLFVLLFLSAAPGCGLLPWGRPVEIPPPRPAATLAPGQVLRVVADDGAGEVLALLTVAADHTVLLPDDVRLPVRGYTPEDLAAVWVSLHEAGPPVRVEPVPGPEPGPVPGPVQAVPANDTR